MGTMPETWPDDGSMFSQDAADPPVSANVAEMLVAAVYVMVLPEMAWTASGEVKSTERGRTLKKRNSSKEIEDYVEFKNTLSDLYNELKIDPKTTNVVLNLPNVTFGHAFLYLTIFV